MVSIRYCCIWQLLVTITLEELQLLILVTVAPHKFIAQPECVIKLEICSANIAGPCLEQQA